MHFHWIAAFFLSLPIQGFHINQNELKNVAKSDKAGLYLNGFEPDMLERQMSPLDDHAQDFAQQDKTGYDLNVNKPRQTEGLVQMDELGNPIRSDVKEFYLKSLRSYSTEQDTLLPEDSEDSTARTDLNVRQRETEDKSISILSDRRDDISVKLEDMQKQINELREGKTLESCPDGWYKYGKSCYYFSRYPASWFDSMVFCNTFQGYLAEINSFSENYFMWRRLKTSNDHLWTGGTDLIKENQWIWAHSQTPITTSMFVNWGPESPSNSGGAEHCMNFVSSDAIWNDVPCGGSHKFICERELV